MVENIQSVIAKIPNLRVFRRKQAAVLHSLIDQSYGYLGSLVIRRKTEEEIAKIMQAWLLDIVVEDGRMRVERGIPPHLQGESVQGPIDHLFDTDPQKLGPERRAVLRDLCFSQQVFTLPYDTGQLRDIYDADLYVKAEKELAEFNMSDERINNRVAQYFARQNYSNLSNLQNVLGRFGTFLDECYAVDPVLDTDASRRMAFYTEHRLPRLQSFLWHSEIDPFIARYVKERLFGNMQIQAVEVFSGRQVSAALGLRDQKYLSISLDDPATFVTLPQGLLAELGLPSCAGNLSIDMAGKNAQAILRGVLPNFERDQSDILDFCPELKEPFANLYFVFRGVNIGIPFAGMLLKPSGYFVNISHEPIGLGAKTLEMVKKSFGLEYEKELSGEITLRINPADRLLYYICIYKKVAEPTLIVSDFDQLLEIMSELNQGMS